MGDQSQMQVRNIWFHIKLQKIFFLLLFFVTNCSLAAPLLWQNLAPGLEYSKVNLFPSLGKSLHVFRIDLNYYQLQLAFTNLRSLNNLSELVASHRAVIGINGGFFTPDLKPLGLRISEGQVKSPIKYTPWWGVFFVKNSHAYIVSQKQFQSDKNISFAVQSGPRLLVQGKIPSLKPGVANRTALGITKDGKVILLVTDRFQLSTNQLAEVMRNPAAQGGLDCTDALNLDGGSSTQLYARTHNFSLNIPSFAVVADAVLVVPRS